MQAMGGRPNVFPYLLLLPALFITLAIVAWPLLETVRLSFTDASLKPTEEFIGLANYEKIFSRRFPEVIGRTFYWMAISVTLKMVVGVLGAMLLNSAVPGRGFLRVLVMPPWIVPIAIGVFMWRWMYNGQFGMISGVAQHLGILAGPYEFLGDRTGAFYSTVVTDVWVGTPLVTIYLLAAMQSISPDLHEAAWVDGASRMYRFRRITLPLIMPAVATMGLLSAIWTFNSFDIIWILTEGGPRGSTTTMIIDTYKTAISRNRYGEGAARAVMIVIFLSSFAGFYFYMLSRMARRSLKNDK
ncbi:trehalose/maltose transport system permease protein MalF [Maritalea myrionectae]|uniref:Trehalose/maltose transport system permease protein MalF n=2 Tax=Maritalea myrionectae TaxID=454601 RepID=A0A2R4MH66_9HYPH|nr:trehalose/maltose transport system permease protein MalF [Maritalea myrionectae]